MAAGQEATPGDMKATERLRQFWLAGAGSKKILWNTDGDWTRCVRELKKYMTTDEAEGYCQNLHKRATGRYTGDRDNRGDKNG
jgi:hypothetical protein